MPSLLSIYNSALSHVGTRRLSDPQEATREAELCGQFYPETLREVLIEYPWSCSTGVNSLAIVPTEGWQRRGFAYAYQLPVDPKVLVIQGLVAEDGNLMEWEKWEKQGDLLMADVSPCRLRYTFEISVPTMIDTHVVEVIQYKLAAKLAFPLAQSLQLSGQLIQYAGLALDNAKNIEGRGSRNPTGPPKQWTEVS